MQHDHILKMLIFNRVRGQGQAHSDPIIVCYTPPSQDASTHQSWDSNLT